MSRVSFRVLLAFLSLSLATGLLLPGEHLHVNDAHQTLIHRHLDAHPVVPGGSPTFDHPEGAPQWLAGVLAGPRTGPQLPQAHGAVVEPVRATNPPPRAGGMSPASTPPAHGPPLVAVGFRAPPSRHTC